METDRLFLNDGVTFRQVRRKLVLAALAALGFVALGTSFALYPEAWQTYRNSATTIRVVGWVLLVFFSIALGGGMTSIARPATVRLSPEGLVVRNVWRTYRWQWKAVTNVRIWKTRGVSTVVFDDECPSSAWLARINRAVTGATSALPKFLNVDPDQLLDAVKQAKDLWG